MAIRQVIKEQKKKFFKALRRRSLKNRRPFSVMFELTDRCNFRCLHCYARRDHQEPRELTTKQVFLILDQCKDLGVYDVSFTGGEPLMRKDIFDILEYASRSGFRVSLLSNGYLIDEQAVQRFKKANLFGIDITFNAMTPEIFDRITRVKGSFKRVKASVEILKEKGMYVNLKSTCMRINKDEIAGVSKFARDLGLIYNIYGEILPSRDGSTAWADKYYLSAREYDELRRKVYPEMFSGDRPSSKRKKNRDKMFNCGVGKTSFSIDSYGRMNFCLEIDFPKCNILAEGIQSCWEKLKKERDKLDNSRDFICKDCKLFDYCGWCPGRSYLETGTFNCCSDFSKRRAAERRHMAASSPYKT